MSDERRLIVVGGPNGAGKTTFALDYRQQTGIRYLAADDIAARLNPDSPERARIEAGKTFSRELRSAIEAGTSLLVESTLSGRSFLRPLAQARAADYRIEILFVMLESPEACIERVRERVRKGGHTVPEGDIRRRYSRCHRNFWEHYRFVADTWHVYLNADDRLIAVAFGDASQVVVEEASLLERFLPSTEESPDVG